MDEQTHHAVSLHLQADSVAHLKLIYTVLQGILILNPIEEPFRLGYQFALFTAGIISDNWIILN
jgi:hypothetical protein